MNTPAWGKLAVVHLVGTYSPATAKLLTESGAASGVRSPPYPALQLAHLPSRIPARNDRGVLPPGQDHTQTGGGLLQNWRSRAQNTRTSDVFSARICAKSASDTNDNATCGEVSDPLLSRYSSKGRERFFVTKSVDQRSSYLFILPWDLYIVGGVNGVVRNLAKAMMEKGSLEPLIAINSWENSTPRQSADSIRFRFSIFGSLSALGVLKAIVVAPLCLWRTFHLLKKYNAQAVNFHFPGIAPFGVAVLKCLGLFRGKLILSYHGTDVAPSSGPIESRIQAFVLRSADYLVACSNGLAERMSAQFSIHVSRVDVIFNGVDASVFNGIGRPDTILPRQLPSTYMVNVGSFIPRKNHTLLLHAFALLKNRYPALHLCIAGADGDERRAVQDAVRAHGLAERVHLFVDLDQFQVALLLSKATLCIQTSLAESFPLALLEASASGLPLVVSDIPGHQELVCNGRTGSSFPLGDPAACADAIAAMLDDPNAAARMAAKQKARVRNDLTWVSSMQQYERLACST